jgi:hypothetical protein
VQANCYIQPPPPSLLILPDFLVETEPITTTLIHIIQTLPGHAIIGSEVTLTVGPKDSYTMKLDCYLYGRTET